MAYGEYGPDRHECHCGKSFLRKEHLRRHQATHEERSFTCDICQRAFTRNDLLRRHIALHTTAPLPSNRSGRACDTCHENKTRCDGGEQCTLCMKRGIACTYDRPPGPPEKSKNAKPSSATTGHKERHSVYRTNGAEEAASRDTGASIEPAATAESLTDVDKIVTRERQQERESDARCARTCFRSVMKAVDLPFPKSAEHEVAPSTSELEAWISSCLEHYFGTFHERWTIVHAPSFDTRTDDALRVGAVIMIPKLIQRGRQLLALLIVALRDRGAFHPAAVNRHSEKYFPGDFKPWVHTLSEMWRLLAYNILKVDVGISLFLNQAPLLLPEELELSIPSTFSLNNAHGIDRFFERNPTEPRDRETMSMVDITTNPDALIPSGFLFQDIQLGLLGLFGRIYRWTQGRRFREVDTTGHQDREIQAQLATWHDRLEALCRLWHDPITNGDCIRAIMMAHMGKETFGDDEWERTVSKRMERFFFNVSMLHGMLSLFLLTDARCIMSTCIDAWDMGRRLEVPTPDLDLEKKLRQWAGSWKGRRALIQSLQTIKQYSSAPFSFPEQTMDPFAHMAGTMAALTLWCWIKNNTEMCRCGIVPDQPFHAFRLELEAEKEQWANEGGIVVLEGTPLCHCTLKTWVSRCSDALEGRAQIWESSQAALNTLKEYGLSRPDPDSSVEAE